MLQLRMGRIVMQMPNLSHRPLCKLFFDPFFHSFAALIASGLAWFRVARGVVRLMVRMARHTIVSKGRNVRHKDTEGVCVCLERSPASISPPQSPRVPAL